MTAMLHTAKAAMEWSTWPSVSARAAARIETAPVSSTLSGRVWATIGVRRSVRLIRRVGSFWPESDDDEAVDDPVEERAARPTPPRGSRAIENGLANSRSAVSASALRVGALEHLLGR